MTKPGRGTVSLLSNPLPDSIFQWQGDENWVHFHQAAEELANRLEISIGTAQRRLRELCSTGDIRSIRYREKLDEDLEFSEFAEEPRIIKPKEWLTDQIDLTAEAEETEFEVTHVDVSENDTVYWLIDEMEAKGLTTPSLRPAKGSKIPRIILHLIELHPQGVPIPGLCPRKALQAALIRRDRSLAPLDLSTLKLAIDEHNRSIRNSPKQS